jgi:hypothetical protein
MCSEDPRDRRSSTRLARSSTIASVTTGGAPMGPNRRGVAGRSPFSAARIALNASATALRFDLVTASVSGSADAS